MTIYTKGTFKIVENPAIVEKFLLTEQSAIVRFYCTCFKLAGYGLSVKLFMTATNIFAEMTLQKICLIS